MAEEVGFEPTVPEGTTVFKTAALVHSATPPLPLLFAAGQLQFLFPGEPLYFCFSF